MPESMDKAEVDRIVAQLREPRPCKVCGTVFRPERLTAVLCSTTCQQRSHRGGDFMYIDRLTTEAARAGARRLHENVDALINRVGEHNRAIRERLSERTSDEAIGRQVRIIWGIGRGRTKSPPGASSPEIAAVIEKT